MTTGRAYRLYLRVLPYHLRRANDCTEGSLV